MKDFLKEIILEAGRISLEYRGRLDTIKIERKTPKDLVTEADKAIEAYLVKRIGEKYPHHAILGEESGAHAGKDYRWIIDPIDGTSSFVHQLPFYSISIAVEKDGEIGLAAVYAPVLNELFMAETGKGATLNGKKIHVSERNAIQDCMVATGFACVRSDMEHNNLPYFNEIAPKARGIRRHGSAAMDMCYVAAGRFEVFWELNLKIYDVAAGWLILKEAKGRTTDFKGVEKLDPSNILATNGKVHKLFTDILLNTQKNS